MTGRLKNSLSRLLGTASTLGRLARDQSGNAAAMIAVAVVPIVGTIGGGVDMTRAYVAEARLAQACDAAVLAGRKVMRDADVSGGEVEDGSETDQEIERFFNYNFPDGVFGSNPVGNDNIETSVDDDTGELTIRVATTVPTSLMRVVGVGDLSIDAECSARRSGVNVDVMMVLDVTGSMATSMGSGTRMTVMQEASINFLEVLADLQEQLTSSGLRVRVGIVPYSQTVNVGKLLYDKNKAITNQPYIDLLNDSNVLAEDYATDIGTIKATFTQNPQNSSQWRWENNSVSGGWDPATLDLTEYVTKGVAEATPQNPYAWKGCVEARSTIKTINASNSPYTSIPANAWDIIDLAPDLMVNGVKAPKWRPYFASPYTNNNAYGPRTSDTTLMSIDANPWKKVNWRMHTGWNNHKNKRYRESALTANGDYPDGVAHTRGPNLGCPSEAQALDDINDETIEALSDYINDLKPTGGTYHDIGMYWGLAMISPQAPFTNDDVYLADGFTGEPRTVNRYIVFMSDGDLDPADAYTSYGRYSWEARTKTTTGDPVAEHRARFRMICEAAKAQGIEVSTVAFSSSISSTNQAQIKGCATSVDHYYQATTATALNDAFLRIARNIGYLRVSK